MKILLKIGYSSFLLPSDAGLSTITKILSRAVECRDYSYDRKDPHVDVDPQPLEVSFKMVPEKQIRVKREPEHEPAEPLALNAPTAIIIPQ